LYHSCEKKTTDEAAPPPPKKQPLLAPGSALLADVMLNEKLNVFGWVGCALCINGSITIVLHAPPERPLASVLEVWQMAMQPGEVLLMGRFGGLRPRLRQQHPHHYKQHQE